MQIDTRPFRLLKISLTLILMTGGLTMSLAQDSAPRRIPPTGLDMRSGWGTVLGGDGKADFSIIPSSVPGHASAYRVSITQPTPGQPWLIQLTAPAPTPLPEGTTLRLRFWARSATRNGIAAIYEHAAPPYEKFLSQFVPLTPQWNEYGIVFRLPRSVPENWAGVRFQMGFRAGEVELTGVTLEEWGIAPNPMPKDLNFNRYGPPAKDPNWLKQAEARIEKIRKGNLHIHVVDRNGKPIPNASIRVEQKRHQFRFGTAISPALFLENADGEKYRQTVLRLFNCVVLENQLKWAAQDWYPAGTAERMLEWCRQHNLPVRGHVLFWPNYEHLPQSKRGLRGEALRNAIREHIHDYVTRYRGQLYVWDVVNEAVTNREIVRELGEGILADAFKWAREADPKIQLAYNDYNISNHAGGATEGHRKAVMEVIRKLLAAGAPVTVLGDQAHMGVPLTRGDRLIEIWNELAQFGLPIEITEYDLAVQDDKVHGDYQREFLIAAFSHPAVESFLMWGFWEGAHWLGAQGGAMFRRDWTPRPAVAEYENLVFHKWWTKADLKADTRGVAKTRVFLGEHQVTVQRDGKTTTQRIAVKKGKDAVTTVKIVLP
jgi:endo-1,4-beta-xylanase